MENTKKIKQLVGTVVSTKMQKTVKVAVERSIRHPRYHKILRRVRNFLVHTDIELNEGDKVVIAESRPYSKLVSWVVIKKVDATAI